MAELIRTRCKQGQLVITDDYIRVELKIPLLGTNQQTIYRSALTGIDSNVAVPSIFGMGGGVNLLFHGQGIERLHADLVKPKVAQEIIDMLQHPQQ
jgi:hypothetical protein